MLGFTCWEVPDRLGRYQVNNLASFFECYELRTEQANQDERFSVLETVKAVFGDDVEITFIPYDNEGNEITRKAN